MDSATDHYVFKFSISDQIADLSFRDIHASSKLFGSFEAITHGFFFDLRIDRTRLTISNRRAIA
jgi:hypothetical protein